MEMNQRMKVYEDLPWIIQKVKQWLCNCANISHEAIGSYHSFFCNREWLNFKFPEISWKNIW